MEEAGEDYDEMAIKVPARSVVYIYIYICIYILVSGFGILMLIVFYRVVLLQLTSIGIAT